MSWQIAADIREMFVEIVATEGSKTILGRNISRKDQLTSGLAEALGLLPPEFKVDEATLEVATDQERIALREHWGSHTAFLTTEGFENLLEIGDQTRLNLFGFHPEKKLPLISRDFSFGVTERTKADGSIEVGLDHKEIEFVMSKLALAEVKSVAICFLHSNKNPEHENQLAAKLKEGGYDVICSHQFEGNEIKRAQKACAQAFARPGARILLEEIEKLGFSKNKITLKNHEEVKIPASLLSGIDGTNSVLHCEFIEDRVRVRYVKDGKSTYWEMESSPLDLVLIDEGGLVHLGPEKIESEPGPVAFGKGIHLSVLDLIAYNNKLKMNQPVPRLKLDNNRVLKQLAPLAKQLQLDPETCAKKFLVLFYEKLATEITAKIGGIENLRNCRLEASGWLGRVIGNPLAKNLNVKTLKIPRFGGTPPSPESWGQFEFENGAMAEGESLAF